MKILLVFSFPNYKSTRCYFVQAAINNRTWAELLVEGQRREPKLSSIQKGFCAHV